MKLLHHLLSLVLLGLLSIAKNRLHLHLTDGPGWRLEIHRYPLLTRIGAWRKRLSTSRWDLEPA